MIIETKEKRLTGILLTSIGGVLGIIGTWILFVLYFDPYQAAMLPPPSQGGVGTDAIIIIFMPFIADVGISAGVLYIVSALSFYNKANWAFETAVIANILALLSGFWPFIPAITVGQPPVFLLIFFPNLIIFFVLLLYVGGISWMRTILALIVGIAFVMTFMNGVASTKHIIDIMDGRMSTGGPIYVLSQRINWIGAFGYAGVTAGIIFLNEKDWVRNLGIISAILALIGGLPLATLNTIQKGGEISMFFFSPVLSFPLLVIFLFPFLWNRIVRPNVE